MELSIIIINYNTYALTKKCIETVYEFTKNIDFEIILVDNASVECDAQLFKTVFPEIQLIINKENVGFAKGNNIGIEKAKGEYILLLNSDIELVENSIYTCVEFLKNHSNVGVVSPMLIYPDGRIQHLANKFPSIKYELVELFRLHTFLLPKDYLLGYYFDHKENKKVDWVWGAFYLTKREIINQFPEKKLPDNYFMYFEDVAWCYEIKSMGYEIHYIATTKAIHHLSASSKKDKTKVFNTAKFDKINGNETDYWIRKKGQIYTACLFLIRALKYLSLRTPKDIFLAKLYLKNSIKVFNYHF
ncbi:MAG TPA: glycosyltransferase family 2 protein [Chitinophagales bacterium]|nr:glycosyltransferase family 2 protein [Chitinophagales bacterium]